MPNLPDRYLGVAFSVDPFDPGAAAPSWTDLTSRCISIGSASRGRQYELDENQAGSMDVQWMNIDEALNPVNAGSPYWQNLVPYRQILPLVMWPPAPVGGAVNLINAASNIQNGVGTDPSFESYAAAATVPWLLTSGAVSPVVTTTNPQQGTKCVTYGVTTGGGTMGVGVTIPCIPGRQYTSSVYVRQAAANTTQIFINGGPSGTSTTTVNAYVRLTVTWTATQPTHQLWVASFSTSLSGAVFVDAFQHEPGASASAFATAGPLIRSFWTRGYVERWPTSWDETGSEGQSSTPCVGPFAILANADLHTEIRASLMAKAPQLYYPLVEPSGATSFADWSGNSNPPALLWTSPVGAPTALSAGQQSPFPGDAGGTGATFTQGTVGVSDQGQMLGTGPAFRSASIGFPSTATGGSWSASVVALATLNVPVGETVILVKVTDLFSVPTAFGSVFLGQSSPVTITVDPTGVIGMKVIPALIGASSAAGFGVTSAAGLMSDGKPHVIIGTVTQTSGGNTVVSLYVDGNLIGTSTTTTASIGLVNAPAQNLMIGGWNDGTQTYEIHNGFLQHVALYNRALTLAEISDIQNASRGYPGETTGVRIARHLVLGGFIGPSSIQTGSSILGPSTVKEGAALLATCQYNADSEFGNFYEAGSGTAFAGRFDRYLKMTSVYTFGENVAGGEYPYEGSIQFDMDPTLVINTADITRSGGIKAHAEDATSRKRYGVKPFTRTVDLAADNAAVDAATWTVASRKAPINRVASVTFNPAATTTLPFGDGTMWSMILSLEIGTRVTLKRRPKSANGGSGITITGDFFVESINHHDINFETSTWLTTVQLSPVNPVQPWILQDATYGVLGSTTVLGF